jgi:glycosyltransferase involved in cell wall biosynthesis
MTIYQHVVEYNSHDGIGNDIFGISTLLDIQSYNNKIITLKSNVSSTDSKIIEEDPSQLKFQASDIHILHYGSSGYPISTFSKLPGKKILRFHNITPYTFFYNYCDKDIFNNIKNSYFQSTIELQSLCLDISEIWYDSSYNQITLHQMILFNYSKIKEFVLPIFIKYREKQRDDYTKKYNILYTGRIVPHKKIEDLLFILFYLCKISPNYKLYLVGKISSIFKKYQEYLLSIISSLDLGKNIIWQEHLRDSELDNIKEKTDFYISMSEHEGFCIPILEAYAYNIPVIAYCSGAVEETMQMGGIKVYKKNFPYIAELIDGINQKPELKRMIANSQRNYLNVYKEKLTIKEYL